MSTRTTFEDRLLDELKREIERREPKPNPCAPSAPSARRLVTPRRIALAATACALAGLAVVFVPGSAADSKAYAVEGNGDGSVTLTIKDQDIGIEAQLELASQMRPWGIQVKVVAPTCESKSWGTHAVLDLKSITKQGVAVPVRAWSVTLHRGQELVLENTARPLTKDEIKHYEVQPCGPVNPTPPGNSPTD
ncbi:hypothetical protein G5C60_42925 [Streptomyces sp. HC44]|uniref:Uncharacterized protein n=1 Tax=Streptomyces scabichelini TaxID=2711217 RepID=A0A6G4VK46_9ACTN|nr:hypothetical protein [Streptomyces scabichelini]NGO14174.1 hypothetical protein [Streptomyces scabichelini]